MNSHSWGWTDNPADPCPYCVTWKPDREDPDGVTPTTTKGRAPRVYRGVHPACDDMVTAYTAESMGLHK